MKTLLLAQNFSTLYDYIQDQAFCPCCSETEKCMEACTFAEDCPKEYKLIKEAREVLESVKPNFYPGRAWEV